MNIIYIYIIGVILICNLYYVNANSACNLISKSNYQISEKDFKVTRYHEKYVMCAAYFCSHNPSAIPLQLLVHRINSTKDNLAIHLDKRTVSFTEKCGYCHNEFLKASLDEYEKEDCNLCPKIEPSKSVEIHVRFEKPPDYDTESEKCIWNINFNMSIREFSCHKQIMTNIPVGKECDVSLAIPSNSEISCLKPNCSDEIISKTGTDKFIHKFIPTNFSHACIWDIHIDPSKTIEIKFSPEIKNYLTVFENNLLNPKWDLKQCTEVASHLKIKPISKNILILYKNNDSIAVESFLEVSISKELCSLPKTIENGNIELRSTENGTVAFYSCFENFYLMGNDHINCKDEKISPPFCVSEKEKYMADDPKPSNESIHPSKLNSLENNLTLNLIPFQEFPSPRSSYKTILSQSHSTSKDKLASDEPEVSKSNISLIELDQGLSDTTKLSLDNDVPTTSSSMEGSGHQSHSEDENGFLDMSDSESGIQEPFSSTGTNLTETSLQTPNSSVPRNGSYITPWHSEGGILFTLPSLEDNMMLIIIIGVGLLLILIIIIISVIVCRNRSMRSGLNRKFDTFQNPIYEKPVVRVPIPTGDSDPSHEKLDLGDLSDSTVLD